LDFAASGLDLLSISAHKLGGPYGIGALLARREVALTAVLHGGGQERDVRSGTLDVAAIAGFAAAVETVAGRVESESRRISDLRTALVAAVRAAVPEVAVHGPDDPDAVLPGVVNVGFPGCSAEAMLLLLDAAGIDCSTGAACSAGVAQPSHVLLAMGLSEPRPARRCGFRLAARLRSPTSRRWPPPGFGAAVSRRLRDRVLRHPAELEARAMRVLAAMSGGVDSAVAAALAVDAGHDVTGVHLALSKNPQSFRTGARGCCSVEDAHDARRAADLLAIPFYVWDLSDRFAADVVDDFVAEYAAGRSPNPCVRCNERIKFSAVLERAVALGFDAVCTGHYARLVTSEEGARGAAPLGRRRQGPVVRARRPGADAAATIPLPLGNWQKSRYGPRLQLGVWRLLTSRQP
jgi:hypothetical protein